MSELVFLSSTKLSETPFTTSEVIAKYAGVQHHTITRLLRDYKEDFEAFGVYGFQIHKPKSGSKGGRPETIYHLNEEQATLLLTYLKNTPKVRAFKKELVRQFYAMRRKLTEQAVARESRKPVRRELTDAIKSYVPDSPHKQFVYKNYTDLAYKATLGKNAAQIRKDRAVPAKANLAEYLSSEENEAVKRMEGRISVLVESGLDYPSIRAIVLKRFALTSSR